MNYLVVQRGSYWRENSKGYSNHLGDAGIYDERTALGITRNNREPPDVLIPLDINIREDIEEAIGETQLRLENLYKILELIDDPKD